MLYIMQDRNGQFIMLFALLACYVVTCTATRTALGELVIKGANTTTEKFAYAYIGSQVEVVCTLNDANSGDAEDLDITLDNDFCDDCDIGNASRSGLTLNISLTNLGEQQAGEYSCWLEESSPRHLASYGLYVQYGVEKVKDVLCIVHDWDKSLSCSWNYGVSYVNNTGISNPAEPDITVQVRLYAYANYDDCTYPLSAYEESSMCVWAGDQFRGSARYGVVINVTNVITNTSAITLKPFITKDLVMPSPVVDVLAKPNSTCALLTWSHSRPLREKVFRVNVSTGESQTLYNTSLVVCNFKPYRSYNVSVEVRPVSESRQQTGFWSNPATITFTMDQAVPSSSFGVMNGSYFLPECQDKRNVTIFFKPVDEEDRNGEITGYRLAYDDKVLDTNLSNPTSAMIPNVPCDFQSTVSVYAMTKVGPSITGAQIYIQGCGSSVAQFAVEVQAGRMKAVWNASDTLMSVSDVCSHDADPGADVTVFWCLKDSQQPAPWCKGEIDWNVTSLSAEELPIPVPDRYRNQLYDFVVGISYQHRGIQWATCFFNPLVSVGKVEDVDVLPNNQALVVQWKSQSCSQLQYPVHTVGYIVTKTALDTGKREEVFVAGAGSHQQTVPANEGTKYNFTVLAVAYPNNQGPPSDPVTVSLPMHHAFPTVAVIVAVVVAFTLFFICFGLWCQYQKYQKKSEKFHPIHPSDFVHDIEVQTHWFNSSTGQHSPSISLDMFENCSTTITSGQDTALYTAPQSVTVGGTKPNIWDDGGEGVLRLFPTSPTSGNQHHTAQANQHDAAWAMEDERHAAQEMHWSAHEEIAPPSNYMAFDDALILDDDMPDDTEPSDDTEGSSRFPSMQAQCFSAPDDTETSDNTEMCSLSPSASTPADNENTDNAEPCSMPSNGQADSENTDNTEACRSSPSVQAAQQFVGTQAVSENTVNAGPCSMPPAFSQSVGTPADSGNTVSVVQYSLFSSAQAEPVSMQAHSGNTAKAELFSMPPYVQEDFSECVSTQAHNENTVNAEPFSIDPYVQLAEAQSETGGLPESSGPQQSSGLPQSGHTSQSPVDADDNVEFVQNTDQVMQRYLPLSDF